MNPKHVLSKIMNILSLEKEEVLLSYAKLADGTILESPTFDVGESVDVISEDGKTKAPAGEHEITLDDEKFKIIVDTEGKITERENVELEDEKEKEDEEVKMESIAGEDISDDENDSEDTEDMGKHMKMKKMVEEMQYRIEEMEKKMQSMEEMFPKVNEDEVTDVKKAETVSMKKVKDDMEEELPKLDGAPVEEAQKAKGNFGKKKVSAQGTFLSKLYN